MRKYIITVLDGMAKGLFASLIIGLIIKQIGVLFDVQILIEIGTMAQYLMGPAIGAGVASALGAPPLVLYATIVTAAIGAETIQMQDAVPILTIGGPPGALIAAIVSTEVGKFMSGKTKLDIIVVPLVTIVIGGIVGYLIAPYFTTMMFWLGNIVNELTLLHPLPMGVLVGTVVGMVLTLPISSAALAIALNMNGLAAGAAVAGCSAQMIGFAVSSFRENGMSGLLTQGIGTSMLQIPNIIKNPWIWIPPTVASAIVGGLATTVFMMESTAAGAGMGTSGLVGQVATLSVMGNAGLPGIIILNFILPAVISGGISFYLRKIGKVKQGDYRLNQ
ncbi:MAG: PTS transporter subunit IIC [Culicoidibacterales bacterium]